MYESQHLRTSEWLPMGLGIIAFLLLGAALLLLLAAMRFPSFRVFAAWCLAVAIRPERYEQESVAHELACGLKRWLKGALPLRGHTLHSVDPRAEGPQRDEEDSEPLPTIGTQITDRHVTDQHEANVLRYLHRRATGTPYADYLPSVAESWQGGPAEGCRQGDGGWFAATQIRQRYNDGVPGQHVAWMFNRMLEILGYVHRQGIVHGAVLPQHLWFNIETHGLRLVNWRSAQRKGRPLSVVSRRYRAWYPAEACLLAGPGLDIYMAANCAMFLAGRPVGCTRIPPALPNPVGQFLRACLLESPSMRPDDAWELHRDARELFALVFGPPKFHRLSMKR